jgi:alginate O-acetyltransferase complex protein AlgJ
MPRCHHGLLLRTVLFLAPHALPDGTPVRIVVPDSRSVEAAALEALGRSFPDSSRMEIDHGPDGPDAEAALLDAWAALGPETARVCGACGPLAAVLLRAGVQPTSRTAIFAGSGDLLAVANGRGRALLAGLVADSWTLTLAAEPPVDAGRWRARLRSQAESGWELRWKDPVSGGQAPARGWLDVELTAAGSLDQLPATAQAEAPRRAPRPDAASKVVRGRHGRLFLARDTHDSHSQMVGLRPLSAEELDAWDRGMRARQARMAGQGARLIQLIGPAPQAVHADDLPDGVALATGRPVMQIEQQLDAMSPRPELLYPLDELHQVARLRDPFSKTDSHWNDLGAYVAYEAILRQLGPGIPIRPVSRAGVSFHDTCWIGDLGEKLAPSRASICLRARVHDVRARLVRDNRVRNHGREAEFACDAAPPTRCVVFGDSWAYTMMPFLAETFGQVVFRHRVNVVDDELVQAVRPDIVLTILTERFCTALPLDDAAIPFAAEIAKKHRARALVEPQRADEPHAFLFSLELDRGLSGEPAFQLPASGSGL